MDTIADEDFGNLVYEYAYSTDGVDYEGRPGNDMITYAIMYAVHIKLSLW